MTEPKRDGQAPPGRAPDPRPEDLDGLLGVRWVGPWEGTAVPDATMFARFTETESGRSVLSGLLLLGDALTSEQLRKVPVTALENSWNLSAGHGQADTELREELAKLPPLRRAEMSPEEFSKIVAQHYSVWAKVVPHPGAAMAAEWDVKAPTMHTWIREARLRGLLPPARRRKPR